MFVAAKKGYKEVVKLLIAKGAILTKANNKGVTPLNIAKKMNMHEVVKQLTLAEAGVA